jgi:parallel beta-helix repeat protein
VDAMVKAKALLETSLLLAFIFLGTFMLREQVRLGFCSGEYDIVVPDNYQKISWAVGNASEGNTIFVKSGVYPESNILVNKSLTIVGEDVKTTVIDGNGTAQYIFHVIANNVVIENLTLQNTDTSVFQAPAIRIYNVTNVTINNAITRNVFYAVQIRSSNLTKIMHSNFSESVHSGIYLHNTSCNNTFIGNTIENNTNGIYIAEPTSQYNKFYHNNIINNTNQIVTSGGVNYFDNGYPSGGNYWSDYNGTDLKHGLSQSETGSDGIFDESYSGDNYPLVNPLTSFNILLEEQTFQVQVSTNATITTCSFNISENSLNLFANGSLNSNYTCRVAIPNGLLSCENLTYWNITIYYTDSSSQMLQYLPLNDAENTYLFFSYNQTTVDCKIEIRGTTVIPEFTSIIIVTILTVLTIVTVLIRKLKVKIINSA